jgi:hypothetical protein
MPKRKMRGGKTIGGINPVNRSNALLRPLQTPLSTWDKIKNFAKQHKIISRGLKAVSGMVGDKYSPFVNAGANFAESYGYGKKKRGKGFREKVEGLKQKGYKMPSPYVMSGSGKVVRF